MSGLIVAPCNMASFDRPSRRNYAAKPAGQVDLVIVEKRGKRWTVFTVDGAKWRVPESHLKPAQKQYTDDEVYSLYNRGADEWKVSNNKRAARRAARNQRAQARFDTTQDSDYRDSFNTTETYYWRGGKGTTRRGKWTGEVRDGKLKMQPIGLWGSAAGRVTWIQADRLFRRTDDDFGGYTRVVGVGGYM